MSKAYNPSHSIGMKKILKQKMTLEWYMVAVQDYLNSSRDEYTNSENEIRTKTMNELFDYILKYNRTGIANKIKKLQKNLEVTFCSCGNETHENAECDDCRIQI